MNRYLLVLLLSIACAAQSSESGSKDVQALIDQGNVAAHRDDHAAAIRDYQEAIKLDPSVRDGLLLRLGQQYLWSGQSDPAVQYLGEYVKKNPSECSPKSTYALALSWSNHLKEAQQVYQEIQTKCPDLKTDAMLGEARVLRWRDRFQAASLIYNQAIKVGTPEQQNDAKLGLALAKLGQDQNRNAREEFRALTSQSKPDSAAFEGLAVADLHLGMPENAQRDIELGKSQNVQTQQLTDLSEHIHDLTSPTIAPVFNFFQDGDGTTYYGGEVRGTFGTFTPRTKAEAFAGASSLEGFLGNIGNHWGGAAIEHRLNESVAFRAQGQSNEYSEAHFNPFTGEGDVIITPTDLTRVDLAVARITIWDNQAALFNHLIGTFGSAGIDQRLTAADRVSFAVDATGWSDGNMRMRYRFTPAHTFEGIPRITVSLPVLYQTYDRGFNFGLFSPKSYIELAPAIDLQFRRARVWTFDFYGRVGGQKEGAVEWKPLGTFLFRVQRDLKKKWGLQGSFAHSSSNVASSSGFSRTSVSFSVIRQF
jgi:tetratricopeptide (TPR) repeat protein